MKIQVRLEFSLLSVLGSFILYQWQAKTCPHILHTKQTRSPVQCESQNYRVSLAALFMKENYHGGSSLYSSKVLRAYSNIITLQNTLEYQQPSREKFNKTFQNMFIYVFLFPDMEH